MCGQGTPKTVNGKAVDDTSLLGDHSEREPPDPIPNSEVKPLSADDSVAVCHAKVGNCQALIHKPRPYKPGFFFAFELSVDCCLLTISELLPCSWFLKMHSQPDGIKIGKRPFDPVSGVCRDQQIVPRAQSD